MPPEILIVGIGNVLLGDDGVGVHAARRLALHPPPEVCVLDGGTDFLALLPHLEACDVAVVIDALDAGGPPGTIYRGTVGDLAAPEARRSLHEFGLLGGAPSPARASAARDRHPRGSTGDTALRPRTISLRGGGRCLA